MLLKWWIRYDVLLVFVGYAEFQPATTALKVLKAHLAAMSL